MFLMSNPGAWHCTELYANNRMEADHGQLKRRLRPMRGLKTDHGARIIIAGHEPAGTEPRRRTHTGPGDGTLS